jgi:hypothetical protein
MTSIPSHTSRTTTDRVGLVVGLIMAVASAIIPNLDSGPAVSGEVQAAQTVQVDIPEESSSTAVEALISQLQVAPEGPREAYEREAFKHWVDADVDGCDTREEVLIEESLVPVTQGASCSVTAGEWLSEYDAVTFLAAGGLDIDHMVPLGEAWDSGASGWDSSRRQDYANDLDHPAALIAVSASSNRSKADRDPAEWRPPDAGYWCQYASDWVTVKVTWDLAADSDEVTALEELLVACGDESG